MSPPRRGQPKQQGATLAGAPNNNKENVTSALAPAPTAAATSTPTKPALITPQPAAPSDVKQEQLPSATSASKTAKSNESKPPPPAGKDGVVLGTGTEGGPTAAAGGEVDAMATGNSKDSSGPANMAASGCSTSEAVRSAASTSASNVTSHSPPDAVSPPATPQFKGASATPSQNDTSVASFKEIDDASPISTITAKEDNEPLRGAARDSTPSGGKGMADDELSSAAAAALKPSGKTAETDDRAKGAIRAIPQEKWLQQDHAKALGATILEKSKGVTCFRVWGPHIDKCWVELGHEKEKKDGQDSQQRIEMIEEGDGLFACQVEGVATGQPYHFVFTSRWNDCFNSEGAELHRRDPYARQTDFDSNTCFVVDPAAFKWDPFQAPSPNELIIYELHVGSFVEVHDQQNLSQFAAVAEKLSYIKELGYNAIEIMPVQEFGGLWGYNPRLLMTPHGKYGTAEELRTLVNTAHLCGLAVIFDLVLNHGSVNLNSLWNYDGYGPHNNGGVYFEGSSDSSWGRRFAFHKREVREMVKAAALTFAIEYNADGLRLDAVHHIPWQFLKELTGTLKYRAPKCYLVAELTPENPQICHDAGFDGCWIHASYYDAMKVVRWKEQDHHMSMLRAIVNGHRGFRQAHQMVNSVLGSHDQCGNRHPHGHSDDHRVGRYFVDQLGGRDNWNARAQVRMWFALQALSRPLPMTFMGTESLQGGWWHIGRYFDWNNAKGNVHASQNLAMVREVHRLRLSNDCLTDNKEVDWCHNDETNMVLGFHRMDYLVLANVREGQWEWRSYGAQTHWKPSALVDQVFNSQAEEFGGWEGSWTSEKEEGGRKPFSVGDHGVMMVNLPKWSVSVFRLRK